MSTSIQVIGNYLIQELVSETHKSIIYRAEEINSSGTVIIKVLKKEFSSYTEIVRFELENKLIQNIKSPGIVHSLGIIKTDNTVAMVLEDIRGRSLKNFLNENTIDILDFINLSIELAKTLVDIHKDNIIHKDIKPHNLIVREKNGRIEDIKITDFGISSILNDQLSEIYNPINIEGTLPYISPEQTGRMNLPVDYRTDLYSLGITFYEMLTRTVPFRSNDPLELIHSHIAKIPFPVNELRNDVPGAISGIILKLLSKSPEERYQSAIGLKNDLEFCREQIKKHGGIYDFAPGKYDVSDRFMIPQKIIGREAEIFSLMDTFEETSTGETRIMLITGSPGVGKSRIVNEVYKPIVKARGYFAPGKYDLMRKDVPFSSIVQAFQGLVKQILTESETRIAVWKERLLSELGQNGNVVIQVIPEIELIIGEQPEVIELSPEESQNRFNHVFLNFVKVFARKEHPLTLFLDDIHWADRASLQLIRYLMSEKSLKYFLLICSFRHNEVDLNHPFSILLRDFEKQKLKIQTIYLNPLNFKQVSQFLFNIFNITNDEIVDLANIVYEKTQGNPFFLNQWVKNLYDEKLISLTENGWEFQMEKIKQIQVSENVIELMAEKISRLSDEYQTVLKISSCIGNRFNVELLSLLLDKSIEETWILLNNLVNEGLLLPSGEIFKFLHDRIQEAAYSLLSESEKSELHLRIGQATLHKLNNEEVYEKIFYISDQINMGVNSITEKFEKEKLIQLNLLAGKKALSSAAYNPADHYLTFAVNLLDQIDEGGKWKARYQTTLSLYTYATEASYLCLKYDQMERYSKEVLENAVSLYDKLRIYEIKIKTHIAQNKFLEGVNTGLEILRLLGAKFPPKPGKIHTVISLLKVGSRIALKGEQKILSQPKCEDPIVVATMRIISTINSATYWVNQDLLPLILLKVVELSLKNGNTIYTPYNYCGLALIYCSLGFFHQGEKLGRIALGLLENYNVIDQRPKTLFVYNTFVRPWNNFVRDSLVPLTEVYSECLDIGDIEFASHTAFVYVYYSYLSGVELELLHSELKIYSEGTQKLKQESDLNMINMYLQIVESLMEKSGDITEIEGEYYKESVLEKVHLEANDLTSLFHLYYNKIVLHYLAGDYAKAVEYGDKTGTHSEGGISVYALNAFYLYDSLARLSVIVSGKSGEDKKLLDRVKKNLKILKNYEIYSPRNNKNKVALIEAELAKISGKHEKAIMFYEKSIQYARENQFLQEEALAYELSANFYITLNFKEHARTQLMCAKNILKKWGANALLTRLENNYSLFLKVREFDHNNDSSRTLSGTSGTSSSITNSVNLDISTILKYSHVLSSEFDLSFLLEKVLVMSIENVGAEKGFLILEQKGNLTIEIAVFANGEVERFNSIPLEGYHLLPISILNYVWKTSESVVLSDACKSNMFADDRYIFENQIKSVLCTPIIYKGSGTGIIYLENNLSSNVFIQERLELISVLSSQAAISIENSRLLSQREKSARFSKEMEITASIQTSLIPAQPKSEGYELLGYMKPAESVGGDYYDVINTPNKDWLIIGDVSGHGILSGLIMMMVQTSIHLILSEGRDLSPSDLLKIILIGVEENIKKISLSQLKYMTITILSFDKSGTFTYAGQHQDILVYRRKTGKVEVFPTEGVWIGLGSMVEDKNEVIQDNSFTLNEGDGILLYTDGVIEGFDSEGNMLGVDGLADIYENNGTYSLNHIRDAILEQIRKYENRDDISFLLIKKNSD
ncbi:MAG: AAA family ATPase [Leptospiraceae bacterium]|nr:AAA family ATPase [Leptospiraceae bacterium]